MKNSLRFTLAFVFACLVCFPTLNGSALSAAPLAGELDSTFKPVVDSSPGDVRVAALQPDGKTIVGGYFRTLNNLARRNLARLNADNSIDTTFSADIGGAVYALAVQTDGKILIGGDFTVVGGIARNRIARLNADGSLDSTFNAGAGADNTVHAIEIQPDGKILLGGSFYNVNSTAAALVSRLNADGSIDATFKSPFTASFFSTSNAVYSLARQSNGKIVLGGTSFTSSSGNTTIIITAITRLNADGTIDSTFNAPSINSIIGKVAVQPDDKILIGGSFTSVSGVSRRSIARLDANGALDASFNPGTGTNLPVFSIFLKADGKILIGGYFSTYNETRRDGIAQLNADGSLDTGFAPSGLLFGAVQSVVAQPSGKILAVGSTFQTFNTGVGGDSITVFNPSGARDTSAVFRTTALGGIRAVATQADGKIIAGGDFNRANGLSRNDTARFNPNGSVIAEAGDNGLSGFSGFDGQVNSVVVQPDGKILIAGFNLVKRVSSGGGTTFIEFGGVIMRQNADGTNDESFVPGDIPARQGINGIALQPDGKIVVVWGNMSPNGFPTGAAARLNADGSIDNTFTYRIPEIPINSVVVQPDGKILIGGDFSFGTSRTENVSYNGVARLNADGSLDATFAPATVTDNGRFTRVYALALQPDGKILVGGSLFTGTKTTPTGVARLNPTGALDASFDAGAISGASADNVRVEAILPLPGGKIIIGGLFDNIGTAARKNVARLDANGAPDASFNASADNIVYALALQTDGKILIGGDFETVNGAPQTSIARLLSEPTATKRVMFDYDGDGRADISLFRPSDRVWYVNNSSNASVSYTQFGLASDKIAPADYDGDGKTDIAVFRPSTGVWFIMKSTGGTQFTQFGTAEDVPQPADFNGDGKAEIAVFRPSTGVWFILSSDTTSSTATQFGASEDKPVAADYDGDGKAEIAVYRPSLGVWFSYNSVTKQTNATRFGIATDKPVASDYDGDGKTDIAVYRPSDGNWYLLQSGSGYTVTKFGLATDLPAPADYDGDGKTDIAVYRPSEGNWYQMKSRDGFSINRFGLEIDKPTPNAFVY